MSHFSLNLRRSCQVALLIVSACSGDGGAGGSTGGAGGSTGDVAHGGASNGGSTGPPGGSGGGGNAATGGTDSISSGGHAGDGDSGAASANGGTGGSEPASGGTLNGGAAGDSSSNAGAPDSGSGGRDDGGASEGGGKSGGSAGAGGESGEGPDSTPLEDPHVQWLGRCVPIDLSSDGKVVLAGEGVWSAQSGWARIPDLHPGVGPTVPRVLSPDGKVAFGCSGGELFRFTAQTGIEGLGQSCGMGSAGMGRYADRMAANSDGSALFTCGDVDDLTVVRWDAASGFHGVEQFGFENDPCANGSASMSSNGATMVVDSELGPQTVSSTNYRFLREMGSLYDLVSAISGDGSVVASYRPSAMGSTFQVDGPSTERCMVPGCDDTGFSVVTDLTYDGRFGVGVQYQTWSSYSLNTDDPRSFFWSEQTGLVHPSDILFDHQVYVDTLVDAQLSIAADGMALLGTGTRHHRNGPDTTECFVAAFGARRDEGTESALPPLPSRCGNSVTEGEEECDDGNQNETDACTARCLRPRLALGAQASCKIRNSGLWCWGVAPGATGALVTNWSPAQIPGLTDLSQIATYGAHSCVLHRDGTVSCWGANTWGQLGNGALSSSAAPVKVTGLASTVQVGVGNQHSCALIENGTVRCWGSNDQGQLGGGAARSSPVPVEISNLSHVTQLAVSGDYACALLGDATVHCWGTMGDTEPSPTHTPIVGVHDVRQISVAPARACALTLDGSLQCWSAIGSDDPGSTPLPSLPSNTVQLALGSDQAWEGADSFVCARLADGSVQCAGYNEYGQLGNGNRDSNGFAPVLGVRGAVSVSAGNAHACAELVTGETRCWGRDASGQLGIGFPYTNYPFGLARSAEVVGLP